MTTTDEFQVLADLTDADLRRIIEKGPSDAELRAVHTAEYKAAARAELARRHDGGDRPKSLIPTMMRRSYCGQDADVWVKMDDHVPGCEEWDNRVQFGDDYGVPATDDLRVIARADR